MLAARGLWVAIALAAAALPGCGGSGVASTSAVGTPVPSASVSATPVPGASQLAEITTTVGTLPELGPYPNAAGTTVSLAITFSGLTNQNMTYVEGWLSSGTTTAADVYPTSSTWTAYTGSGNVVIYFELEATPAAVFSSSPALAFTVNGAVTGTSCTIGSFTTSNTWVTLLTGGTITPSGSQTNIAFAAHAGTFDVGNQGDSTYGPAYLVVTCQ